MVAGGDVGELRRDPQPGAGRPHAALENVAHRESTGDRGQVAAALPSPEGRSPGCYADPVDPHERVHDLLGHALAEVILVLRRAHVRERQDRDRDSGGGLRGGIGSRRRGHLEPRLTQAVEEGLHVRWLPPLLEFRPDVGSEVRPQLEQIPYGFRGGITLPELPVGGSHRRVHTPVARQIALEHETQCAAVVALAVRVVEVGIPVPSRMVRIELLGASREREATLPVACIGQQLTEKSDRVAVHGVQCDGPLRRIPEALEFLLEEERLGQAEIGQRIGRRRLDGTPRGD